MEISDGDIRQIVTEVLKTYNFGQAQGSPGGIPRTHQAGTGIFSDINQMVEAARIAQRELVALPLATRRKIITAMREVIIENNFSLCESAVEETGLGNIQDKLIKNELAAVKSPGVEDVEPLVFSDEHGLTLVERAPYGVIGAITPVTNPIATITSNGIGFIASGNSGVFNVHPGAARISCRIITLLSEAICKAGGPPNVLCAVENPSIESANLLMGHKGINLLVVTGGPGVVKAAMLSGKKAICAGPGNPPCVVDETADVVKAGKDIVNGAGFDNNIVCICEKEILAVESIADQLKMEMCKNGAFELNENQIREVTQAVISKPGGPGNEGAPNRKYVGKSAQFIAGEMGIPIPQDIKILLCEVSRDHPLVWTEQLMPVIPIVRMPNVDAAIDLAVEVEHGFKHTAIMHSHDIVNLTRMARVMNCSIFVKNGPCYAGLGQGGAGYATMTIASPTGEGVTRARTFTRERRCTLVDSFRII